MKLFFRWKSIVHYFPLFLPASTDGSDKKACNTNGFYLIYQTLKLGEELLTKSRVKFLLFLCDLTRPLLR